MEDQEGDGVGEVEETPAKLPKVLDAMLQWTKARREQARDIYDDFLYFAQQSTQVSQNSSIQIEAFYMLKDYQLVDDSKKNYNNTLLLIFRFYCKLRQTFTTTFEQAQQSAELMSFKELEIFCRDFKLLPRLLTKEDLRYLWENMADLNGNKLVLKTMDFPVFQIYFTRLALWTYHKPGLKKLIITLYGFMPSAQEILHCFCKYLRLDDVTHVHTFLRTVSRKTQGAYNYRSKGEVNSRIREEIMADSNVRQLAALRKNNNTGVARAPSRPATSPQSTLRDMTTSTSRPSTRPPKVDDFGERVRSEAVTKGAHPREVVRLAAQRYFPELPSLLPARLQQLLSPELETLRVRQVGSGDEPPDAPSPFNLDEQLSRLSHATSDDEDEDSDNRSVASSVASVFFDTSLDAQQANLTALFEPRLLRELDRYCYVPGKVASTDWVPTHGPMVDLGLLSPQTKVLVNVKVTNSSGEEVQLDVSARNMQAGDTQQRTYSKPLVPGFSRSLLTTFTVPAESRTVLGFVDVAVLALRRGGAQCVSVPVFYRVDAMASQGLESRGKGGAALRCTGLSLPDVVALRGQTQRAGLSRTHSPHLPSFEK